jgi:hypothetical protein
MPLKSHRRFIQRAAMNGLNRKLKTAKEKINFSEPSEFVDG